MTERVFYTKQPHSSLSCVVTNKLYHLALSLYSSSAIAAVKIS
jgi:hypothetical protein